MAEEYGPSTYGEKIAEVYDKHTAHFGLDTDGAVERLAELAGGGPVLELAIGTGRLALPLAALGLEVHGIDASEAMVAKLREKPGGADIPVTVGDFAEVGVEGRYPLIFVGFNTFFALLSQEDQIRCFANVAAHLTDKGLFVLEGFVPDLGRYDGDQRVSVMRIDSGEVMLDVSRHDPVAQRVEASHILITEGGTKLYPVNLRYAFPSELDLMARLAGLELKERWGGWRKEEFRAHSQRHVSVYGR
jgi:SAM-dependent methyltransferase